MDLGHWVLAEDVELTEDTFGFIYCISNTAVTPVKYYIGKKQCISRLKRKPLKGKKRNRIDSKQSDWREYTGSSNDLNADILKYGKDKFIFKIIKPCSCKWELAYEELKEQIIREVLFRSDYYNAYARIRLPKAPKNLLVKN